MARREYVGKHGTFLSIEVTTECNGSCSHCFVRARDIPGQSLPRHLVETIVREGYAEGYRHLHITGGEPLLWNGLLPVFELAFGLGYETAFLNTNGTLLTPGLSAELAAFDGLAVSVSLQGPKRFHDRMRGKGSWERAVKGIENGLGARLPVHVFTTATRSVIPALARFADKLFKTLPAIEQLTLIQLIRVPGDVFDLSAEVLRPDDFIRLVRLVSFLNLYGLKVNLLNNPLAGVACRLLHVPMLPPSLPLHRQGCLFITAGRRITLAHSTTDRLADYQPGVLSKVLKSREYRRGVSHDRLFCGECTYSRPCRKEGMVRPSEWYRDMEQETPYCKRVLAAASSYG